MNAGARPAGPGEFTRRAFLNGKIDLIQAESVADLIRADTEKSYCIALNQLSGRLSERFLSLKNELKDILSLIEANIDFAEEDIELFEPAKLQKRIEKIVKKINEMVESYKQGRLITQGIRVAIIGPPNAGKSSLFNAFCEKERVIVDEHPGTTRDTIEEAISIKGQKVTFIDTAGIRKSRNKLESKGITLAQKAAQNSDLALVVFDASVKTSKNTIQLFKDIPTQKKIFLLNKCDLKSNTTLKDSIKTSTKDLTGIQDVKNAILNCLRSKRSEGDVAIISRERQKDILLEVLKNLKQCLNLLKSGGGEELLSIELNAALSSVGKITGEVTDDDILNHIFNNFCIGK